MCEIWCKIADGLDVDWKIRSDGLLLVKRPNDSIEVCFVPKFDEFSTKAHQVKVLKARAASSWSSSRSFDDLVSRCNVSGPIALVLAVVFRFIRPSYWNDAIRPCENLFEVIAALLRCPELKLFKQLIVACCAAHDDLTLLGYISEEHLAGIKNELENLSTKKGLPTDKWDRGLLLSKNPICH